MTYRKAVALIAEATNKAHDERCFETGNCDIESELDTALEREHGASRRTEIVEAGEVISAHLRQYDREQITPKATEGRT